MDILATAVRFDENSMWVELSDGRTLSVPLAWFPRLLNASRKQRAAVEIGRSGLHWDEIDEDISINGLLAGRRDQTRQNAVDKVMTSGNHKLKEASKMRQPGLDNRHRDRDGEIHHKRSDTLVKTLRKEYGPDFAHGYRSDAQLGTVLRKEGVDSLHQLLKKRQA